MMQMTFGPIVGMPPVVPVAPHPEDILDCTDSGNHLRRADCFFSADGLAFEDCDERYDHDLDLVGDLLKGLAEWWAEYRQSDDCMDEYVHLVAEYPERVRAGVEEWIDYNYGNSDEFSDEMIEAVCDDLMEEVEMAWTKDRWDCDKLAVIFDSYDLGECHEQIEIRNEEVFSELYNRGDLVDMLEEWDIDYGVDTWGLRGDYPNFTLMHNPGLVYFSGCSDETINRVWDKHNN
jgi:hypothetical protein